MWLFVVGPGDGGFQSLPRTFLEWLIEEPLFFSKKLSDALDIKARKCLFLVYLLMQNTKQIVCTHGDLISTGDQTRIPLFEENNVKIKKGFSHYVSFNIK